MRVSARKDVLSASFFVLKWKAYVSLRTGGVDKRATRGDCPFGEGCDVTNRLAFGKAPMSFAVLDNGRSVGLIQ